MADCRPGADDGSDLPKVGDCIAGKYRVERTLGAGGMGAVLAAQHIELGSRVAIKVLLPAAAQLPGAVERFLREARAAAALCGDHVARVLDTGKLDTGMPYLVMDYLAGRDLGKVLAERGPLPIEEAAHYLLHACDAMAEAHSLGIVHRDLKPGNLFVVTRPNGSSVLKVLDFGLAKILDGARTEATEASLTNTGLVIGTPHYMPPEQLRGLKFANARSDIWSLGVIAYQVLTGRRPFVAPDTVGLITAIAADEPVPPRTLRPDIPAPIDAIIMRCLHKNPEMRTQTVQELAAVFEPFAPARGRGSLASAAMIAGGSMAMPPSPTPGAAPRPLQLNPVEMYAAPAPTPGIARASSAADNVTIVGGAAAATAAPMTAVPVEPTRDVTTLSLGSSEVRATSGRRSPRGLWLAIGGAVTAAAIAIAAVAVGLHRGEQSQDEPAIIAFSTNAAASLPATHDVPVPSVAVTPGGPATSVAGVSPPASASTTSGTAGSPRVEPAPSSEPEAKLAASSAPATSKPAGGNAPSVPATSKPAGGNTASAPAPSKPAVGTGTSTTSKPAVSAPFDPLKAYQ
jgi:eukaryotic-like serine/threonine-protein kinase